MRANELRTFRTLCTGLSVVIGSLASAGPIGVATAGIFTLCLWVFLLPVSGIIFVLVAKPAIDLLWAMDLRFGFGTKINAQSLAGVMIPAAVLLVSGVRLPWPKLQLLGLLAIAYLADATLGVLLSPVRGQAISDFLRIGLPLAFLVAGLSFRIWGGQVRAAAAGLALFGLIPVMMALLQILGFVIPSAGGMSEPLDIVRIRGWYQHPLDIAMRCSVALPFALCLWNTSRGSSRVFLTSWAVALAAISAATLVRSAIVATTVQISVWLWMIDRRRVAVLLPVLMVVLIFIVGPVRQVVTRALVPLRSGDVTRFGSGRALLFLAQTRGFERASITQKLFGRGLHTTAAVSVEYSPLPDINPRALDFQEGKVTAHNQILRLVTETGLIGVGIFVALVLCVIRVLAKVVRSSPERDDRQFAIAVLSVMAALGFYSMSATPFDSPAVSWPLWFAIGVAAAPVVNGERSLKGEN